ncbi:hypothetical protein DPMN_050062 [Dreissena polymorpha]|uniref:Uncharacterized protein n=1 Tax=Dreissena polymorpha TaxID=45954 RepID=A0A9D4CG17_DREPO|nr:hypothetical protein DPMN_050062 [Dreissena polymorpha]
MNFERASVEQPVVSNRLRKLPCTLSTKRGRVGNGQFLTVHFVSGECKGRFTSKKVAYCVKYHPEEDKQHLFVAGTSDKKIICVRS